MKKLFRFFIIAAIFWSCGFLWFITRIPSEESQQPVKSDAIVVLTGGSLRLERGFELLTEGAAPKMFISGVEDGVTLTSLLRKKEYQTFAGRVSEDNVDLGYQARSTIGNATETALWASRQHVKTILLVTGNYHIPRSIFELHVAMPDVAVTPVPVFPNHFAHNEWWRHGDSIRLVISEYHKYITSHIASLLDS